jgi:hypothetical protein
MWMVAMGRVVMYNTGRVIENIIQAYFLKTK